MIARKNALNSISAIKRPHQATSNRLRIATEYAELHAGRVVSRVTQDEEFLLMDNKIQVTQLGEVGTTNQLTNPFDRAKKKTLGQYFHFGLNIPLLLWKLQEIYLPADQCDCIILPRNVSKSYSVTWRSFVGLFEFCCISIVTNKCLAIHFVFFVLKIQRYSVPPGGVSFLTSLRYVS